MKVTREYIELQGFEFECKDDDGLVFLINKGDVVYEAVIDEENDYFAMSKFVGMDDDDDDDMVLDTLFYEDQIPDVLTFFRVLHYHEEITNKVLVFPIDFADRLMLDNTDYKPEEFDELFKLCLILILAKEEYERIRDFLQFRKDYFNKRGWEYKDIDNDYFMDYSRVTEYN
jgi:hypothetical protein